MKKITLGFFGAGIVNGGTIQILQERAENLKSQNLDIHIKKICIKDPKKARPFEIPPETQIVTNLNDILDDPEIDIVVEAVGGNGVAKEMTLGALKNGKHLVSANKTVIAANLHKFESVLKKNENTKFGLEASVAGAIPIISSLKTHYAQDKIDRFSGIMNGTTNFILSKMEAEGANYIDVIKEAQELGYAEADPTYDVEGYDARAKIIILAKLAWGISVDENEVFTQGITTLQGIDFEYARMLKGTIKLLTVAQKNGNDVYVYVTPTMVPYENSMAKTTGPTNIIQIDSEYQGQSFLVGPGAGSLPTGTSMVADIVSIARGEATPRFFTDDTLRYEPDFQAEFFVRFMIQDGLGIVKRIGAACEANGISIDSVLQLPADPKHTPFVVTLNKTKLSQVQQMCDAVEKEDFCLETSFFIPVLK